MSVWAILVAAGRGERLGLDRPKAFAKLGDEPLLAEPLRRLEACSVGGRDRPGRAAGLGGACDPPRRGGGLRQGARVRDRRRDEERLGAGGPRRGAGRRARRPRARRRAAAHLGRRDRASDRSARQKAGTASCRAFRSATRSSGWRRRRRAGDRDARRALGGSDAAGVRRRRAPPRPRRTVDTRPTAPAWSKRRAVASRWSKAIRVCSR